MRDVVQAEARPVLEPARELFFVEGGLVRSMTINGAHENFFGNPPWAQQRGQVKDVEKVHSWTFACLKRRSDAVAAVPIQVMTGSRRDKRAVESTPLQDFFDSPNPFMSRTTFLVMWQRSLDMKGKAFVLLDPFAGRDFNPNKVPVEAWVQDPDAYEALDEKGVPVSPGLVRAGRFASWRHRVDTKTIYPKEQVIFYEALNGAPLTAARVASTGDYLAADYNRNYIANDCRPSGWVEIERKLTDAQRTQVRSSLEQQMAGTENAGRLAVFEAMKFTPNPQTRVDMQWLEGREFSLDELCGVYGVPKALLGKTDDVTYANHTGQVRVFYENAIFPEFTAFEDAFWTSWLRNHQGGRFWVEFDRASIPAMQSDLRDRMETANIAVQAGWPRNAVNERFNLGFEEIDGGDVGMVPSGLLPLDDAAVGIIDEPVEDEEDAGPEKLTPDEVTAILSIVSQVQAGTLPAESAKEALSLGYHLTDAEINALIDPADEDDEPEDSTSDDDAAPPQADDADDEEEEEDARDLRSDAYSISARTRLAGAISRLRTTERAAKADRERWTRFERDHVRRQEAAFSKKMRGVFFRQRREILKAFDVLNRARGTRLLTADDVNAILGNSARWAELTRRALEPVYQQAINRFGRATLKDIGIAPSGFSPAKPDYIRFIDDHAGNKLTGVTNETIRQVREQFIAGLVKNETPVEIRARLSKLPGFSRSRARTVAITEMGGTVNRVRSTEYAAAGIEQHRWVTSNDEKVRESHASVDLEVRSIGEAFSNGLMRPHDPNGPADEVVNCRCGVVAVVEVDA